MVEPVGVASEGEAQVRVWGDGCERFEGDFGTDAGGVTEGDAEVDGLLRRGSGGLGGGGAGGWGRV